MATSRGTRGSAVRRGYDNASQSINGEEHGFSPKQCRFILCKCKKNEFLGKQTEKKIKGMQNSSLNTLLDLMDFKLPLQIVFKRSGY